MEWISETETLYEENGRSSRHWSSRHDRLARCVQVRNRISIRVHYL